MKEVNEASSNLNSLTNPQLMQKICEIVKGKNKNDQASVSISKTTFKRIKRKCNLNDSTASKKTRGRVEAFGNIRNSITFCCLLSNIQSVVNRANFHSVDDVSVLVNGMGDKPEVRI